MKYVLCLLLALVVGGKSFAKGNGDLNLKNFPEGYGCQVGPPLHTGQTLSA